jgi:hypothetical protein
MIAVKSKLAKLCHAKSCFFVSCVPCRVRLILIQKKFESYVKQLRFCYSKQHYEYEIPSKGYHMTSGTYTRWDGFENCSV